MKRIILVEDDEPIRDIFNILFETDFDLTCLESGMPILSSDVENPDIFILDKNIPGVNGLDVCRFIKGNEKFSRTPVIMLSASPDIVVLAQEAGADHVIVKPFSIIELQEAVKKYANEASA